MNKHLLSIDLEDWYTSGYLREFVKNGQEQPRVELCTEQILNLLDRYETKATFFTLGMIAKKHPKLIKKIYSKGHEIASHGYSHTPLWNISKNEMYNELVETNKILEDLTGEKVIGFRAPYASLDNSTSWIIDILEELDFKYDSSIFPMKTPIYGVNSAPQSPYFISSKNVLIQNKKAKIFEIPFTIYQKLGISIPCTGGIYGRFLPFKVLFTLLNNVSKVRDINFYFHPWEIDAEIPKIKTPVFNQIVSYYNTSSYLLKIEKLLQHFLFTSFKNKYNFIA